MDYLRFCILSYFAQELHAYVDNFHNNRWFPTIGS